MSVIEVRRLFKSFGQHNILKDLELTVEKGEVIVNHFYYPDDQRGWQREPDPYHAED